MFGKHPWVTMNLRPFMDADGGTAGGTEGPGSAVTGDNGGEEAAAEGAVGSDQSVGSFTKILENPAYQAEFDRMVNTAISKAKTKWEKEKLAAIESAKTEAEKLARMNADQKAQYEREQAERKLREREAAITRRELIATAKETLVSKGLPIELAETLNYTDADACNASIEAVTKAFTAAVTKAVNEKLRQAPPGAGDKNTNGTGKAFPKVF